MTPRDRIGEENQTNNRAVGKLARLAVPMLLTIISGLIIVTWQDIRSGISKNNTDIIELRELIRSGLAKNSGDIVELRERMASVEAKLDILSADFLPAVQRNVKK